MTAREQAIFRMHNAGLSDAEIVAVLAMRGDEAAVECRSAYYVVAQYGAQPLPRAEPWPFKCE